MVVETVEKQGRDSVAMREGKAVPRASAYAMITKATEEGKVVIDDLLKLVSPSVASEKDEDIISLQEYDKVQTSKDNFYEVFDSILGDNGTLFHLKTNTTCAISALSNALKFIRTSLSGEFTEKTHEQGTKTFLESMKVLSNLVASNAFAAEPAMENVMRVYDNNTKNLFIYSMNHKLPMVESYALLDSTLDVWMQSLYLLLHDIEYEESKLRWVEKTIKKKAKVLTTAEKIDGATHITKFKEKRVFPSLSDEYLDFIESFDKQFSNALNKLLKDESDNESHAAFLMVANSFYEEAKTLSSKMKVPLENLRFVSNAITTILEEISDSVYTTDRAGHFIRLLVESERKLQDETLDVNIQTVGKSVGESLAEMLIYLKSNLEYGALYERITSRDQTAIPRAKITIALLTSMQKDAMEYASIIAAYVDALQRVQTTLTDFGDKLLLRRDD